ncbi:MAG TPA: 30S ribosomal protein S18 [Candidatus Paceibacterota bacterium]|jgi:small subunit ribosomal protein S18|nr:30S ribosomal protein S18 [Candidatus Paceibacterota bacterium]
MNKEFSPGHIPHIDYKDIDTIKKFVNPHGKIMPRRRTGLSAANQRALAQAVKRARFMALIPYIVR